MTLLCFFCLAGAPLRVSGDADSVWPARQQEGTRDIAEVRVVTGVTACNQLLAEGWVLLGVYPLTTVADMTQGEEQKKQDIQRYVRRLVGYVVGRKRG